MKVNNSITYFFILYSELLYKYIHGYKYCYNIVFVSCIFEVLMTTIDGAASYQIKYIL